MSSPYAGTPELGRVGLEIPFFEVSAAYRLRGIGTAVIHALIDAHPDRRFVAFSEKLTGSGPPSVGIASCTPPTRTTGRCTCNRPTG